MVKIEKKELPKCLTELVIEVEDKVVQEATEVTISAMAKEAKIPGFRPGKAPKHIIEKNFSQNSQIVFIKNFSKGFNNALISGFKDSKAEAILVFMADDHTNHGMINSCYSKFKEGYHVVCPSRFIKGGKMVGNPLLKSLLTKMASFFLFNFTTFPIKDPTNSFRLFSKELINKVKIESNKGFTLSLELTAKAHRLGYKIIEIPSTWIERDTGKSRFKLFTFILPYTKWLFYIIKTSIFYKNEK